MKLLADSVVWQNIGVEHAVLLEKLGQDAVRGLDKGVHCPR